MTPTNDESRSEELDELNSIAFIADDTSRTSVYTFKKRNQYKIKSMKRTMLYLLESLGNCGGNDGRIMLSARRSSAFGLGCLSEDFSIWVSSASAGPSDGIRASKGKPVMVQPRQLPESSPVICEEMLPLISGEVKLWE